MTEANPADYPPHTMSPSEEAATVGRYREDSTAVPAPFIDDESLKAGRIPAAPPGEVYVRDETVDEKPEATPAAEAALLAQPDEAVQASTPDAVEPEAAAEPAPEAEEEASWEIYTIPELKTELDRREIPYGSDSRKAELVALLQEDDAAE